MADDRRSPERYRRIRLLGEGGAGQVWLVEDSLRPGLSLALKELTESARGKEDSLRREFVTLASLRHPNLVEVFEFDLSPRTGLPEFTLEYIDGEDLVAAARRHGPAFLLDLSAEALRALAFLHDFGLVHRDLKPANLLVRKEPRFGARLVVLDFGLALRGEIDEQPAHGPAGTLAYMAPELFAGEAAGPKTDLYALGALLFEAVHGHPPFDPDPDDLARHVENLRAGKRKRPALPAGFPSGFQAWLDELISPDPADRPAGASEALARLNAACGESYETETRETRAARLRSGRPPGREEAISRLRSFLGEGPLPSLALLAGEAGSGKTRLLRWLGADAVGRGWDVLTRLPERGSGEGEGPDLSRIAYDALSRSAARRPTLLCLDELETAPRGVVALLDRIAQQAEGCTFKIVAALRPAEATDPTLTRMLTGAGLIPAVERVDLEPFDETSIARVLERVTGGGTASPQRVAWALEASEGNALVLESLLIEEAWERGTRSAAHRTLEQSIANRVSSISDAARRWLEVLVVLGRDSARELVSRVAVLDPSEADEAAVALTQTGLATVEHDTWSPASRLIAEQVLRSMPDDRRRDLHRRAAQRVEEAEDESVDPGRLARLWHGAGERERARELAIEAADRAESAGDPSGAADWIRLALLQLDRRDPSRLELRRRHADLLLESNRYRPAYRALATCLRLTSDPGERATILNKQARTLIDLSRFREALHRGEQGRELARAGDLPAIAADAGGVMGMAMSRLSEYENALPILIQAAAEHDRERNRIGQAECLQLAGVCASRLRRFEEARPLLNRALSLARAEDDTRITANVLISKAILERRTWNLPAAIGSLEEARRVVGSRVDLKRQLIALLTTLGNLFEDNGQLDKAIVISREAKGVAAHIGNRTWLVGAEFGEGSALGEAGRPAEAAEVLSKCHADASEVGFGLLGFVKLSLAEALMQSHKPDERQITSLLGDVLQSEVAEPRQLLGALLLEMERCVQANQPEPFRRHRADYEQRLADHREAFGPPLIARAELALAQHLVNTGQLVEAARVAEETAGYAEEKDLPSYAARAHALLAEARRGGGDRLAARKSLEKGRRLLDEAANRIEDRSMRRDFLARPVFRALRESARAAAADGEERLLAIYDMIRALNSETDPESILQSMLDMALDVVRAERGMLLLREEDGKDYRVRVARNLEKQTIRDASEFSRNVVLQAGEGKAVLAVDTGQDDRLRELKSVSLYGIRSVLCVPLRSRKKIIGAVYLDNRSGAAMFTPDDLRFLEAFADHAALALENAQARRELELENQRLQRAAEERVGFGNIVGRSAPMQLVYDLIGRVAETNAPVLIYGESGTGKELVARAVHFNGPRRRRPFVTENCAAIPESLLESELFGHVKGAFTGADRDRTGLFEQAHLGTLMLDEVGDMSPAMQARLLRVLQEGEVRRVGGETTTRVDVRVIAATHRELAEEVKAGRFREDLLYRLRVLEISLPPLRDRAEDIALLVDHFLRKIADERDRSVPKIRTGVIDLLESYSWPGNIRQLENALQRLTLLAGDGPITMGVVENDRELRRILIGADDEMVPVYSMRRTEEEKIREALRASGGNRTRAAKLLGISRATIFRKIKQYGLS